MAGRLAARAAAISRRVASGGWAPPGGSSARPGRVLPRPPPPAAWSGSFGVGGSPRFQPRASIAPPVCANSELRPLAALRGSAATRRFSVSPGGSWRSSRQHRVSPGPPRRGSMSPRVVPAGGDAQHPAHGGDGVVGLLSLHELERLYRLDPVSLAAKKA